MPSLNIQHEILLGYPGHDQSALVLGSQEPHSVIDGCTIDAGGADWALKMPDNVGSEINGGFIRNGKERALDIVRGAGIEFNGVTFECGVDRRPTRTRFSMRKQCDIGIKGPARTIAFNDCTMTDLLIGDFSIYSHYAMGPKTGPVLLRDCKHPLGADHPIIVRVLWGEMPDVLRSNVIVLKVPDPLVKAYFHYCRKYGDTRVPTLEPVAA